MFQLPQEVQSLRGRFVIPEVFLFQFMSCEICTPRNLMFSTLCTVRPLILTGACFGCDLWKSINIHIEHRFSSLPQPSRCLTSSLYIVFSVHPLWGDCGSDGRAGRPMFGGSAVRSPLSQLGIMVVGPRARHLRDCH